MTKDDKLFSTELQKFKKCTRVKLIKINGALHHNTIKNKYLNIIPHSHNRIQSSIHNYSCHWSYKVIIYTHIQYRYLLLAPLFTRRILCLLTKQTYLLLSFIRFLLNSGIQIPHERELVSEIQVQLLDHFEREGGLIGLLID